MKKIVIFLTILLLSIIIWFLLVRASPETQEGSTSATRESENRPVLTNQENFEKRTRVYEKNRAQAEKELIKRINAPFQFSGKVVDQNGKCITDVRIKYRISQPRRAWDSNTVVKTVFSGSDGTFSIRDKGSGFSFQSLEKEGYRMAQGQMLGFSYTQGPGQDKRDNDRIREYVLIQEDKIPSLMVWDEKIFLGWDGVPVRYNLETGKISNQGELQITAQRGEVNKEGKFDWSCEIAIVKGMVLETSRDKSSIANKQGYKPFWERSYLAVDNRWGTSTGITYLHFQRANETYGLLRVSLSADPRRGKYSGSMKCYLNPSGSRLLDYDASRKIK